MACVRNNCLKGTIDGSLMSKKPPPLRAEPINGSARSELIKLIRHRLHEPLGPTLLVLQLLLREESLSPQGVALIRMLQRSIKEEVRAIHELLTIIESFIQEPSQADSRAGQHMQKIFPIVFVLSVWRSRMRTIQISNVCSLRRRANCSQITASPPIIETR